MFETIRNAWKTIEIRKKILFTLFIILLYRLGNAVPVPYVDTSLLANYFKSLQNTVLGLYNVMSGSSFSRATVFALSIQPYINASIIIQLLTIAVPALERLQKEGGEDGKKKLEQITRYTTIGLGLLQGFAYYMLLKNNSLLTDAATGAWPAIVIILSFAAGATLLMWLGEQITEFGIGNGISIILFVSIVARFPNDIINMISAIQKTPSTWWIYLLLLLGVFAIIVLVVFVTNAERRLPVQYSKRVVGRKMYGGKSTFLPLKVNMSGVMPIIFAQSIAALPATIGAFCGTPASGSFWEKFLSFCDTTSWFYAVMYALLIVAFSYFYATIQFNPIEVSNNLKKNGGYIPGFRPGKPTSEFIAKVLSRVTLFGAIYLAVIAITPIIISNVSTTAKSSNIAVGGTSIMIVVAVALETVKGLESQMLMRHYKGFLE